MKDPQQARILVIDDEESIRESLKVVLEEGGYLVDTAESGQQAIVKSKDKFYNLALIDIRLPDMDGLKLLTAMTGNNPRIKKIIITGYPSLENAIEAVNQGADAYIVKPFTMESLLLKIKVQLQKQKDELRHSEERVKEYIVSRGKARNPKTSKLKRS